MKFGKIAALGCCAFVALSAPAVAGPKTYTNTVGNMVFTAQSLIVGQTSTASSAAGGDPIYFPTRPQKDGVAGLLMTYSNGDQFVCSGSLASDRMSIVTAAHCVSSGGGVKDPNLVSTDVIFWNGGDTTQIWFEPGVTTIGVTDWFVRDSYTGEVIDQNDIAVLRLATAAPDFAVDYDLYTTDIEGLGFNVAGYGARGESGATGAIYGTGRLKEGDNIYDYRLGNAVFGTRWSDPDAWGVPFEQLEYSYISDFDRSGFAANDTSELVSIYLGVAAGTFAETGVGAREVGIAGGDSGGPGFIGGKLASVNSWGGSFGSAYGDVDDDLNSSWGEFSGYVPIFIHADWIESVLVAEAAIPEPQTWAMLILGFGAVGMAARRRRTLSTVSA